jgi:hypothetical protein
LLALDLLILFRARGVITREVEAAQGSRRSGHDLLKLLLVVALAVIVTAGIVVLVGGVELLPLAAVGNEVSGVITLEAAPR